MKDYANPILLLIIIALLSWKVSMGIETPGTVELWLLTLCVTGCIVNGLLAIARALASKKAVMGVVWSMVYLIFCSCSWVTFREEKDYRAEIAIYNELNTKWHSENCNPFSLKDEEGRTLLELAAILGKKTAVRGLLAQPEAQQSADTILRAAFRAAENGHHELIRMIATQPGGFDFNRKCDGSTPLIAAVLSNRRKTTTVLLQFQADVLGTQILRPHCIETTALGAATLAGLAVGLYRSVEEIAQNQQIDRVFASGMDASERQTLLHDWSRAVERSRSWDLHA